MAVVQIVTAVVTSAIWVSHMIFAGDACWPACDGASADRAVVLFVAFMVGSFLLTIAGGLVAWRKERDLS